jgi:hypothetical protein
VEPHRPPDDPNRIEARDPIARLLKLAGSRPQPDPRRTAIFEQSLHREWRRGVQHRARRRRFAWAAASVAGAAAAMLFAWLPSWRSPEQPATTLVVGRVARVEGIVHTTPTRGISAPSRRITEGDEIQADTLIETTDAGRAALMLDESISLRVDVDSRLVVIGDRVMRLERGAVYVDSSTESHKPVLIQTQTGDVRDIGTQFDVRQQGSSLRVRVREGEVLVDRSGSAITARVGEALQFDAQGRHVRSAIPTFGPEWAWTSAIAPQFQLEGSTVQQFLEWVAREQGWRWRFVNADTARQAAGIVTHGSLEGYTPEEALDIVLPTCGLSFERNRDEIIVSFLKESSHLGK